MDFIVQTYKLNSNEDFFYAFKTADSRFAEKWGKNQVNLSASIFGNFMHFFLMLVKDPRNIHDGLMKRLLRRKSIRVLCVEGFFSILSETIGEYFDKSARTSELLNFLRKLASPKIFFIDESVSIRIINLKVLKLLGTVAYVSQDVAYDRYNFGNNVITKTLMYKLESDAVAISDLVVACSERDRVKYLEMGARKVIFYPNIYPISEFEPASKDPDPCISIVLKGCWGSKVNKSLEEVFKALSRINKSIKVNLIGIDSQYVPKNLELHHYEYVPNKIDYLTLLSKSWIGINIGIHLGGTNERKYDYAMAGLVIFSDAFGSRGDFLPHEYTFVDRQDLTAKLEQILEYGKELIEEMGLKNRKQAIDLAERQRKNLLTKVSELVDLQS